MTKDTITITQAKAAAALETIEISKERRADPTSPLTPAERSDYRSLNGSLLWLGNQTRMDISVEVSRFSQKVETPRFTTCCA